MKKWLYYKENKKFQYSLIRKGGKASQFAGSLQWIEDAGIICRCHNLSITELPLDGNAVNDVFKVYMVDTGLFVSMLEDGTQLDILRGNLFGYKGAIFENLVADIFTKKRRKLYYFRKDSTILPLYMAFLLDNTYSSNRKFYIELAQIYKKIDLIVVKKQADCQKIVI